MRVSGINQESRGFAGNIGNIRRAREILDNQIFTGNLSNFIAMELLYLIRTNFRADLFSRTFHNNSNFGTNFA